MPIALGSSDVSKIYLGSNEIDASYLGTDLVLAKGDLLFTVDTDITTNQFGQSTIDVAFDPAANYSGLIEWADGTPNTVLSGTGNTGITHIFDYPPEIIVQVRVSGSAVPKFLVQGSSNIISVENLGNVALQDTDRMFRACNNLASVNTGDYITSIGNEAFRTCTKLVSVTLPDNVNFLSINQGTFLDCYDLTNIIIPDSVTKIKNYAFSSCTSLASITLPNSLQYIGLFAFQNCISLTNINLPSSLINLEQRSFSNCTSLATINCFVIKAVIDNSLNPFINTASPLTINVPNGTAGWTAGTGQSIGGNTNVTVNLV